MHKVGDLVWRGYARTFGRSDVYYPEIRPGRVIEIDADGLLRVQMEGVIPGSEGRRNPGAWIAWHQPPERYFATPDEALADAKAAMSQIEDPADAA